jgi:dTDP-4-dehydrorhamnose reductase
MIIGKGDIASVIEDSEHVVYFASGVSNSKETTDKAFLKEKRYLDYISKDATLVYFSTLAIYDIKNSYTKHKLSMEAHVKKHFPYSTIVRLGNIAWGKNPHILFNYLKSKIQDHKEPEILDEYRHIVTIEEFRYWLSMLTLNRTSEMNITGERMKIKEFANRIKKGIYEKNY